MCIIPGTEGTPALPGESLFPDRGEVLGSSGMVWENWGLIWGP